MKSKKRVLSIDWDYFVDADYKERIKDFPDATTDELSSAIQSIVWANRYVENPKLQTYGLTSDYNKICMALNCAKEPEAMMVCDSHRHAFDFVFAHVEISDEVEVVNIDFHHDIYPHKADSGVTNAGNWALRLKKELPHMKLKWVKRDDSEMPNKHISIISLEDALQKNYDLIFLCRSGAWTPPHLDRDFIHLANILTSKGPVLTEEKILEGREYHSLIEQFSEQRKALFEEMGIYNKEASSAI